MNAFLNIMAFLIVGIFVAAMSYFYISKFGILYFALMISGSVITTWALLRVVKAIP